MADPGAAAERSLRVFISYSRRDQAFVDDLVAALDAYPGFEPFIDRAMGMALQRLLSKGSLPGISPWSQALEAKLADAAMQGRLIAPLNHEWPVVAAVFSADGAKVVTASEDNTARIWDVTWATKVRGAALRDRVCAEKLKGAEAFTAAEAEAHILIGQAGKSPCDRRGPLSRRYWTDAAAELWQWARGHLTEGAGAAGT